MIDTISLVKIAQLLSIRHEVKDRKEYGESISS